VSKIRNITHALAIGAGITISWALSFVQTPAGQALLHQYPILSKIVGIAVVAGLTYHSPNAAA
jgi:hypothetical protein